MKKGIVLISGGIDSATVLAIMQKMDFEIYALSFNYSQRHMLELERVKEVLSDYYIKEHKIINIDLKAFGGSALTDDEINVPKYKNANDLKDEIPITYVPARNTIFLSYALGYAEIIGANDIFIGVHATDYSNYPDCRPEYIKSFEETANLATKIGIEGQRIKINTPIINMSKAEIIKTGLELGVDYSKTISCYDPIDKLSCGKCHACLLRIKAFQENNMNDPISYVE